MHPTELRNLEQRLESQLPLIGGCLRQRTAKALARYGSPSAVRVLAKAIARNDDRQVLAIALDALRQVTTQQCIDEVCAVWSITRHKDLAKLLTIKDWVASAPVEIKVLSALKAGKLEVVAEGRAEIVEPLLKAFNDADSEIASRASQCAISLTNPDAIDYLCERWSKNRDKLLEQVILQGKYVARRPVEVKVLSGLKAGKRQALADDGVEIVAPLLQACKSNDPKIAIEATELLNELKNQSTINALCREWVKTRENFLSDTLQRNQYVATNPPKVRVLSALKIGKLEKVTNGGAEVVAFILQSCCDADLDIARAGQAALRQLKNPEAQDFLCTLVIDQEHQLAYDITMACQYTPSDSNQRALFFFLTEQWDKYESLDFEHTLLRTAYELGNEQLRQRIAQKIRQAGCPEWVHIISGGYQGKHLREMTHDEWEITLKLLNSGQKWTEMWQLAQVAPLIWSVRLLHQLKDANWVPKTEFAQLVQMGQNCLVEDVANSLNSLWRCQATLEHSSYVDCLAISPNGKFLASASRYSTSVKLWSLPNGKLLHNLPGNSEQGRVHYLKFSSNSQILASHSNESIARVWSLPDGKLLETLSENSKYVVISPDSKILVSRRYDTTVKVWSLPDGNLIQTLTGHSGRIINLTISSDSKTLASGSDDKTVKLWSLPDGNLIQTLTEYDGRKTSTEYDGRIINLTISPGSKTLVLFSDIYYTTARSSEISVKIIRPDDKILASSSDDSIVKLWSPPDGKSPQTLTGHRDSTIDLTISPDNRMLASSSDGKTVKLWKPGLYNLIHLPIEKVSVEDMHWIQQTLRKKNVFKAERDWLEFILALARWQQRFDIEMEEATQQLDVGEFDIEIEG